MSEARNELHLDTPGTLPIQRSASPEKIEVEIEEEMAGGRSKVTKDPKEDSRSFGNRVRGTTKDGKDSKEKGLKEEDVPPPPPRHSSKHDSDARNLKAQAQELEGHNKLESELPRGPKRVLTSTEPSAEDFVSIQNHRDEPPPPAPPRKEPLPKNGAPKTAAKGTTKESEVMINDLLGDTEVLAEQLAESRKESQILKEQLFETKQKLHEAHDFIFSLQPKRANITESEAQTEFISLCECVNEWIQTKLGDALYEKCILTEKGIPKDAAKNLLGMVSQPGREAFGYPETDEYNVIAAVMRFLCTEIFDREFYVPIENGATEFLGSIEKAMRILEPRRDLYTCRAWRSELYTAISNRIEFGNQRKRQVDTLTASLTSMLKIFLPQSDPKSNSKKLAQSIQTAIIEPAMQLAHKLHLSVDRFTVEWTQLMRTKFEERSSIQTDYNRYECMDLLRPGKLLKFPSQVVREGGREYITYLFDISPGLVFESVKADNFGEPKVLKKARILVAVTKEEQGPYLPPKLHPSENASVLGWLEERLYPQKERGGVGAWRAFYG